MFDAGQSVFRVGGESTCELIIERTGSTTLTFAVVHYSGMVSFGPEPFPLGRFLRELGLTAEDCAVALESEGKTEPSTTNLPGHNRLGLQGQRKQTGGHN